MSIPFACDMTAIPAEKRGAPPESGPLQLRLTGDEGVKDFIRAELHLPPG